MNKYELSLGNQRLGREQGCFQLPENVKCEVPDVKMKTMNDSRLVKGVCLRQASIIIIS